MRRYVALVVVCIGIVVLLSSCMTPRQMAAAQVVSEAVADGRLSSAEGQEILEALDPQSWLDDIITILGGGGTGYLLTNYMRNRARRRRGEPVLVKKPGKES